MGVGGNKLHERTVKTVIGRISLIELDGPITSEVITRISQGGLNGLQWNAPENARNCDQLATLPQDKLLFLRIRGRKIVDDSALSHLQSLRYMDVLTRSTSPLDLSGMLSLHTIMVDDRIGLTLPAATESLRHLELMRSYRPTTDLGVFLGLEKMVIESRKGTLVSIAGTYPKLRALWLRRGSVARDITLNAQSLTHLSMDQLEPSTIDVAGLRTCPRLQQLSVRSKVPVTLVNSRILYAAGCDVLKDTQVRLELDDPPSTD